VWTLHNAQPHELQNADAFWMLRRGLAELADRILIHNVESGRLLSEQAPVAASKLFYLPHPAYLGVYKAAGLGTADPTDHIKSDRVVLLFGMVRRYKAVERTLDWLTPDFTSRNGLRILVAGEALQGDAYADQLQADYGQRTDVQLDLRRIPDSEVAPLFSSVSCLVLGYSRFLTSGAALLGLSLEVPIVAPRVPQMTELLPTEVHRFLYTPEDADDFRRAVAEATSLDSGQLELTRATLRQRADDYRPEKMSAVLGSIYDELRAG
jgi:glycosyltransferase involved in cell wall biosynthesis